ncbi:hypothetical protein V2A60_000717 [Cordyceps javanica]|uniref:D-amino-acid oxidase protein n=1 Tax=Cordyceps javanica TaxID=43265 RepID=A0A545VZX7_9HYPO|nr:d-amino-acid oxidase protein [Cordyceps javanica]TQW07274.1 FAD dependent oxidoreductase [Cordyceps javanica]
MATRNSPLVIVLGAGVIGLQTAINLLEAGYSIAIVARDWPGDQNFGYTSMWAGAQWRSTSKMHEKHMQHWERRTFQHWLTLTSRHDVSETGIDRTPGMYYWDSSASQGRKPEDWIWWAGFIPKFKQLPRSEVPVPVQNYGNEKDNIEGITYESFSISPDMYLRFLQRECERLGGRLIKGEVDRVDGVFAFPGCEGAVGVVNCAGVSGVKTLMGDDKDFYPTKGQAVVVRGEAKRISTGLGKDWEAVVVPRKGLNETFLGVTKIYGDGSLNIDDAATQMILDQAKPLAPELLDEAGNFHVLRVQVGLRPTRTGGAKVALESLPGDDSNNRWVCHNYGHHGAGFEESFGCAETVVKLVSQRLGAQVSSPRL